MFLGNIFISWDRLISTLNFDSLLESLLLNEAHFWVGRGTLLMQFSVPLVGYFLGPTFCCIVDNLLNVCSLTFSFLYSV